MEVKVDTKKPKNQGPKIQLGKTYFNTDFFEEYPYFFHNDDICHVCCTFNLYFKIYIVNIKGK